MIFPHMAQYAGTPLSGFGSLPGISNRCGDCFYGGANRCYIPRRQILTAHGGIIRHPTVTTRWEGCICGQGKTLNLAAGCGRNCGIEEGYLYKKPERPRIKFELLGRDLRNTINCGSWYDSPFTQYQHSPTLGDSIFVAIPDINANWCLWQSPTIVIPLSGRLHRRRSRPL